MMKHLRVAVGFVFIATSQFSDSFLLRANADIANSGIDIKKEMLQIYPIYNKGAYSEAVDALNKINAIHSSDRALLLYWKGLCYNHMLAYAQAIPAFQGAVKLGAKYNDLQYEMGQALYANQQLKSAREAFKKSAAQGYKKGASTYYVGFISQILEDYTTAANAYQSIQGFQDDPENVKQAALFQISEMEVALIEKEIDLDKKKLKLKKKVFPALSKVIDYDRFTPIAEQARQILSNLKKQMGADEISKFHNGVPMAINRWYIKSSQDIKYDTNVLTKADQSLLQISNTGSGLSKTEVYSKYEYVLDRRWALAPEIDMAYMKYFNQEEPLVFQNDNLSITSAIRTRLEHVYSNAPAAMNFDMEFNLLLRDWQQDHSLPFYSRFYNFTLGERVSFFKVGSTILSVNMKLYSNEDVGQNALNPAITLTQNFKVGRMNGLSVTLSSDYNRARDDYWDRIDYRLTTSLNLPVWVEKIDFSFIFDFMFVNTMNQFATRGYEKTINPSILLTRSLSNNLYINLNYSYTKNISLDLQNYAYSKSVMGLGVGCRL